jgi:hypothetical protein
MQEVPSLTLTSHVNIQSCKPQESPEVKQAGHPPDCIGQKPDQECAMYSSRARSTIFRTKGSHRFCEPRSKLLGTRVRDLRSDLTFVRIFTVILLVIAV